MGHLGGEERAKVLGGAHGFLVSLGVDGLVVAAGLCGNCENSGKRKFRHVSVHVLVVVVFFNSDC